MATSVEKGVVDNLPCFLDEAFVGDNLGSGGKQRQMELLHSHSSSAAQHGKFLYLEEFHYLALVLST